MALKKIIKYGDKILRRKCPPVKLIDKELALLIGDMLETMYDAPGVGLSANQVGVPMSLAVIDVSHGKETNPIILINPKIVELKGRAFDEEGCLSVPGLLARTKRYSYAKVQALNIKGFPITVEGEGLIARALQHELDHLNGRLFIDHLTLLQKMKMQLKIRKLRKAGLWA